ncbi:hypothetical protein BT96DRAFT_952954 [Gymnopus androsaceus JB14]|uniref:DNA replication factor Cdt1 C-terminal domain-containing protein n=1 Tax=Gymnopus androsaceus JB14 TaxID=1447944 RepID=A0A6A4II58_9AGAR|nr:hypothetical protein BT96DRAFT_952954 [Gymnopus androsaceus JB14]
MSEIYSSLNLSPKKKRAAANFDADTLTPKKLRLAVKILLNHKTLVPHLTRLQSIQTSLQQALSHALASCAASPSSDTGVLRNVVNHISLSQYSGLSTNFTDWTRGSMGFVVSSATQFSKVEGKRVPAYGIGIEVEIDLDKDMGAGMAAVARWTAATETRRTLFSDKLHAWTKMHANLPVVPMVPLADLPVLSSPLKASSLTRVFASIKDSMPMTPSSPSRSSSSKSPTKRGFAIPASIISTLPEKGTILFPSTPSSHRAERTPRILNLRTPTSSKTPTTSRRQALYDRIRQRSLSASPSKSQRNADVPGSKLSKDQMLKLGQEEMRRRCLLGRLGGVAESVWMLFSSPNGPTSTPSSRKRRTLPLPEVASSIVKSSPVPISVAEANESLELLTKLCPFFLKQLTIGAPPASPGRVDSAQELVTRSPKRVKREAGGLREVREIIRRELELHD